MRRLLFRRPSPAMLVACLALFVALAGGAYAATQLPKNSVGAAQLKSGAVTPPKLSAAAKAALSVPGPRGEAGTRGPEGPRGDVGPRGDTGLKGDAGPKGDTGPKGDPGQDGKAGPGAKTLTWDTTASENPTRQTIGTLLGDTFSGECLSLEAGKVEVKLLIQTSDGSLRWDIGNESSDNGVSESHAASLNVPVGSLTTPTQFGAAKSNSGGSQAEHASQIVQLAPVLGYLNIHEAASTQGGHETCHASVMGFTSE